MSYKKRHNLCVKGFLIRKIVQMNNAIRLRTESVLGFCYILITIKPPKSNKPNANSLANAASARNFLGFYTRSNLVL